MRISARGFPRSLLCRPPHRPWTVVHTRQRRLRRDGAV